ncbi:MAG: Type 1 glutamine amidotransferase-like domain-containing protein, partial [Pseudonocardia sp.]|nr:Type 1 glutamine amidotransferase-like domain-containing protein [Pseudonocardia sp.]
MRYHVWWSPNETTPSLSAGARPRVEVKLIASMVRQEQERAADGSVTMKPTAVSIWTGSMDLLLLSNSRPPGRPMLSHAADELAGFVTGSQVLFIPYALADHDAYVAEVTHALAAFDIDVTGAPSPTDPVASL